MGQYGITGWSGGARVPLTYNLRAGQMRGMGRVNVFPNNTYVNNNYYGSNYDYGCNCNSNSTPGWMNWMMGIGLGGSLLGGILGMFAKKDDSAEGAGGDKKTTEASKELSKLEQAQNAIKGLGKEYSVKSDADGNITFEFKTKDGHVYSGKTLGELNQAVYDAINKPATTEVKPENTEKPEKAETPEEELEDGDFTSAIDEKLGTSSQIKGKVSINPDTREVNIEDTTNTYTYAKGSRTIEYKGKQYTVYSLKGATNNKTGKAVPTTEQEYILINGQLVQPKDCKELKGLGTGSTPPPDETPTVKGAKTSKATSKKSNSAKADTAKPETKKAETFKASYTVSMRSGNKCTLKIDKNGNYRYFDKSGKEISEAEFQKQTGKTGKATMDKINNQQRAKNPDKTAYTANLTITAGKHPTATFKDKNGQVHTFTGKSSGVSFYAGTRQKAQIENLRQQIKAAGFTNVNLVEVK